MIIEEQTRQEKYRRQNQVMINFEKIKQNFKLQDLKSYDRMLIEKKLEQIKASANSLIENELKDTLHNKWTLSFFKPYEYPI